MRHYSFKGQRRCTWPVPTTVPSAQLTEISNTLAQFLPVTCGRRAQPFDAMPTISCQASLAPQLLPALTLRCALPGMAGAAQSANLHAAEPRRADGIAARFG